nr:acyltransferase [Pseudomonadota bacterium]
MLPNSLPRSYPGIDLLRALAAVLVLFYHVVEYGNWAEVPNTGLGYLVRHGWTGVNLFLTISGFVITLSALDGVRNQGPAFRRPFAVRRLARILPLYLLTCLVFVILIKPTMLLSPALFAAHVVSHLLFVHNLTHFTHGSINGPSWSVALEMQFYLAMVFAAPWLARTSALRVVLYAVLLATVWRYAIVLALVPGGASVAMKFVYLSELPGVIDEFALGVALAMVASRNAGPVATWLTPAWKHFWAWLSLALALLVTATRMEQAFDYWGNAPMTVGWHLLLSAGFAALLASAITFPWAGKRLLAPLRYVGDI